MNNPELLLLDGDIGRYEWGAVLSKGDQVKLGDVYVDVPQSEDKVERFIKEKIDAFLEATGCKRVRVYLSEGKNFRFSRATIQSYKGNRAGFVKPYHYKTIGEIFKRDYDVMLCTEFEADDHLCHDQDIEGGTTCIASRDKDLRTNGGWHYSWPTRTSEGLPLHYVSVLEGKRWFYTQCLTGDSTDNILGCAIRNPRRKGVGRKAAEGMLAACETEQEMFNVVANAYKFHRPDDWREALLENGTLLYMCKELAPWEDLQTTKELLTNYEISSRNY